MFLCENWDVEESTVSVEFYSSTSLVSRKYANRFCRYYLFSLIFAIPRRACETFNSELSRHTGGADSNAQVSAFKDRGLIMFSKSSILCQSIEVAESVFIAKSRSITNWVAETITCCACRNTDHACTHHQLVALRVRGVEFTSGSMAKEGSGVMKRGS